MTARVDATIRLPSTRTPSNGLTRLPTSRSTSPYNTRLHTGAPADADRRVPGIRHRSAPLLNPADRASTSTTYAVPSPATAAHRFIQSATTSS